MPCTLDCLGTYGCGSPIEVSPGAIYSPFVGLRFAGGDYITVGNHSAPMTIGSAGTHDLHHAVISSMQYGFTNQQTGYGADIEITDQGGVMYRRIIRALNKTLALARDEAVNTILDFGWIITDCNGDTRLETATTLTGKKIRGVFTGCEQTYDGGLMKLKITLRGTMTLAGDVRHDDTEGDEDNRVPLREALERLFTERQPSATNVRFEDKDGHEPMEFMNRDGGAAGPRGTWPMAQQNPLATARTWLQGVVTTNGRGILMLADPDNGDVVFRESGVDPRNPICSCARSYGTYVVNGGNCSPVLKFTPTFKWPKGWVPGGGATSPGSASGNNDDDVNVAPINDIERAGSQTNPTIGQHEWQWRNPDEMASANSESMAAHMVANAHEGGAEPGITGDLVLHGSPEYANPILMVDKTIALIVINPFHITTGSSGQEWITTSNCNAILSNKNWQIIGLSHSITNGGSFTTTIKLSLPSPNNDIDATDALGGNGCGTESFDNSVAANSEE